MAVFHRAASGLRAIFQKRRVEQELDAELEDFLETAVEAKVAAGWTREAALRAARLELGGPEAVKDRVREVGWESIIDGLGRDVSYALRALGKSPGFATVAIVTLALGIGATTAIYSVVDAILLQPLPFPNSDRLVRVVENVPSTVPGRPPVQVGVNSRSFVEWWPQTRTLTDVFWCSSAQRILRTDAGTMQVWGGAVAGDGFAYLGARALLGRTLVATDAANPDVVVLGFEAWQRLFHGDPGAIGRTIEIPRTQRDSRVLTVVGVMPAGFAFPSEIMDFYTPFVPTGASVPVSGSMMARLAPGMSLQAAIDEANIIGSAIRPPRPNAASLNGPRFEVQILKDHIVKDLGPALRLFLASVAVVLLIVSANVANLLLARGTGRQREIAVRFAIGASRGRVVRQVLTECLVLALFGGALGAVLGAGGIVLVKRLASVEAPGIFRYAFDPSLLPRVDEVGVNMKMFAIAFGIASLTSVVFGILPALHLSRKTPYQGLTARSGGSGRSTSRLRSALVIAQFVMATVLLVGAGLLTHSFVALTQVDRGYDASNVLSLQLVFPTDYPLTRKVATIEALLARFRANPAVESAGFTRAGVLVPEEIFVGVFVPSGHSLDEMRSDPMRPLLRPVGYGFLTAMRFPLLEGRDFEAADEASPSPVMVISQTVARRYFGSGSAVGQVVDWHLSKSTTPMRVVGVVEDVHNSTPDRNAKPEVFVNYHQLLPLLQREGDAELYQAETALGRLSFAIRVRGNPASSIPAIEQTVRSVDTNAGIDAIIPLRRLVASSVALPRFYMVMLNIFAGVAGALAAIGIYGVLAYLVAQRTPEIGMRMALGAKRSQVLALVLRQGLVLTTIGIGVGLVASMGGTRLLQGMLFGVTPLDLTTFIGVSVVFGMVAMLASYLPARRATKVDPMVALRND